MSPPCLRRPGSTTSCARPLFAARPLGRPSGVAAALRATDRARTEARRRSRLTAPYFADEPLALIAILSCGVDMAYVFSDELIRDPHGPDDYKSTVEV